VNPSGILELLHVLILDDDPDMRTFLGRVLKRQNVGNVVEAANADDALVLLRTPKNEINFVLSDWNMPGISGLDLCRALKAQKPIMPILMITGRDDISSVRLAQGAGIDGYLVKPVSPTELVQKIDFIVRQTWEKRIGAPHDREASGLKS
jgi:DNA-binding response OmpR family regulator